jgi:hypothetical protein
MPRRRALLAAAFTLSAAAAGAEALAEPLLLPQLPPGGRLRLLGGLRLDATGIGFGGFSGMAEPERNFEAGPDRTPGSEPSETRMEAIRNRVFDLMSPSPATRDEVVRLSDLTVAEVNAALAELELSGRVVFTSGGGVALA